MATQDVDGPASAAQGVHVGAGTAEGGPDPELGCAQTGDAGAGEPSGGSAIQLLRDPSPAIETPYLSTSEAAEYLRMSERKLRTLIAERRVPFTRIPSAGRGGRGKLLFDRRELDTGVRRGFPKTRPTSRGRQTRRRTPVVAEASW